MYSRFITCKVSVFEVKKAKTKFFHDILIFCDAPVVSSVLTNAEATRRSDAGELKGEVYPKRKIQSSFIHPHVIPESSFLYYRGFFGGWLERNTVETGNTALFASERWSSVLLYWLVCTFLIHYRDSDTNTGFQNQGTSYSFQVLIQNRAEKGKSPLQSWTVK